MNEEKQDCSVNDTSQKVQESDTEKKSDAAKTEEAKPSQEKAQETHHEEKKHDKHHRESEIEDLRNQIQDLQGNVESLKNEYARAYADTQNMRKRLTADFDQQKKYRIQDFALDILPVLDNCERALNQKTEDEAYRKGVQMIYDQLTAALKKEGVTEIEALNQPFDPNLHQALMTEKKEGVKAGIVTEVLQKGYKLKDRLLRAAMVKVSE